MASALGWLASCSAYYRLEGLPRRRGVAALGGLVALTMILMKVLPFVPGHFTGDECAALALWALLGAALWFGRRRA